jgi:hypothetical protein
MPEGVVEKQPDRAAVWTFQEAEIIGGSEVISFNSGPKFVYYAVKYIHFLTTTHFRLYLANAEMTLDLEVNEAEVKVLTSLASVTWVTGCTVPIPANIIGTSSQSMEYWRLLVLIAG